MNTPQPTNEATTQVVPPSPQHSRMGPVGQVIAFLICVGFPGLWTLASPVSWVKFERQGESVSARAKVCLFFVIPYRSLSASGIKEVETRASIQNTSNTTPRKGSRPDDQRYLVLRGDGDQVMEFPVADSSMESVLEQTRTFVQDSQATELKYAVVSHWGMTIFGSVPLSLLTLLYILNALVLLIQAVQRRCGVPPEKLFFAVTPEEASAQTK